MIYIILGLIVLAMIGMISTFREIKVLRAEIDQFKSMKEIQADEHTFNLSKNKKHKMSKGLTATKKLL